MTKDDKIRFTLRLPSPTDKRILEESKKLGISKNAFILLALDKVLKNKKFYVMP